MNVRKAKAKYSADNRGLTLVELIVGVTILAIIITPLLHAFVTGANTERKSREYGEATTAAENIMEIVQGNKVEELGSKLSVLGTEADGFSVSGGLGDGFTLSGLKVGTSSFDALLTLTPRADAPLAVGATPDPRNPNNVKVAFANAMDAVVDMTAADSEAMLAFASECAMLGAELNEARLARNSITIEVNTVNGAAVIKVQFGYSATVEYKDDAGKTKTYVFSHRITPPEVTVAAPKPQAPAFSLFLFYDAYFNPASPLIRTVKITNNTSTDFNVFLVDNQVSVPLAGSQTEIAYWYQKNKNVSRVFSNIVNGSYKALTDGAWYDKPIELDGRLAEMQKDNRYFDIEIKIGRSGGNKDLVITGTKLN